MSGWYREKLDRSPANRGARFLRIRDRKKNLVNLFNFFQWKYQINIDGTVAAYRLPYLLAGDSLVLRQDSPYYEHFYHDLQAWQHYVPFKRDLSDLEERIEWARNNDKKVTKQGVLV